MADNVTYYAVVRDGHSREDPTNIARRTQLESGGISDESLRIDGTWGDTSAIVEWKRAEVGLDLFEIDEEEARRLAERLQARWNRQ